MSRKLSFSIFLLMMAFSSFASVIINEVMPKNVSYKINEDFQFSGWAEIYNNGSENVDLSLYFLSDSFPDPTKWQFNGNVSLAPGERTLVYLDESEEEDEEEDKDETKGLHANFKLPSKKGCLYLSNEVGIIIDKLCYDTTYRNTSYGRFPDGSETKGHFSNATPGKSNSGVFVSKKTDKPTFSLKSGFYDSDQQVSINATSGAKIYYTLDGKEPTLQSEKYSSPITINKNTVIRAIAVVDPENELQSDPATASYFINENVSKLPIISLVADPDLIYGDDYGLLVAGKNGSEVPSYCSGPDSEANYWNDWDRPANFEFFDPSKKIQMNQEVKIGNFGACSRTKYIKSIKVNANKVSGESKLDYPIFTEKPYLKWKSVVLRNAGNDFGRSYLRDGFIQTLAVSGLDLDHQAYQPSMVFINGKFYGMLNIRERSNKDFIYSNYGLGENDFYLNEGNHANESESGYGDLEKLCKSTDLNDQELFDALDQQIDVNEFLNYFLTEMWCGNQDWPGGNIKCWKTKGDATKKTDGKWRWILYDTEYSTSLYNNTASTNCFTYAKKHNIFGKVLKNERIKELLLAKFSVHLATTFSEDNAKRVLDSLVNNIKPDVQRHIDRINKAGRLEADFSSDISNIRSFVKKRIPTIWKNLKAQYSVDTLPIHIYSNVDNATFTLNNEPIKISDFRSYFFTQTHYEIVANEPAGYTFDHWEVKLPSGEKKNISSTSCSGEFAGGTFKAVFTQNTNYDANAPQIFLNEICASNSVYVDEYREPEDWFELYNSGSKPFDLGGLYLSIDANNLNQFQIPTDASTIVPANGYIVFFADKEPEEGPLHTNFKISSVRNTTLFLTKIKDGTSTIIDSVTYTPQKKNESYARFGKYEHNAGEWKLTGRTTFAKANIYGTLLEVPMVVADANTATIYPNPVKDQLYFSLSWNEESLVSISSVDGKNTLSFTVKDGDTIDLSTLESGFYLLTMQTPEGRMCMKLIKE